MSNTKDEIRQVEQEEYLAEFLRIADYAKFPPFSMPQEKRISEFLIVLSREYDAFVGGQKAYNSYEDVLEEYAEEIMTAISWMSLGYSPVDAAIESTKRSMLEAGEDPSFASTHVERFMATHALSEDPIEPWGFL